MKLNAKLEEAFRAMEKETKGKQGGLSEKQVDTILAAGGPPKSNKA